MSRPEPALTHPGPPSIVDEFEVPYVVRVSVS